MRVSWSIFSSNVGEAPRRITQGISTGSFARWDARARFVLKRLARYANLSSSFQRSRSRYDIQPNQPTAGLAMRSMRTAYTNARAVRFRSSPKGTRGISEPPRRAVEQRDAADGRR